MIGLYVLDEAGEPLKITDPAVWAAWIAEYREAPRVGYARIADREVSTVFLGIDAGHGRSGKPLLWETMVFGGPGHGAEVTGRYASRAEAEAGHALTVDRLRIYLGQ